MTPKEKAKELVDRYVEIIYPIINTTKVKQCALIAVEEILNNDGFTKFDDHLTDYWQNVKNEIELL